MLTQNTARQLADVLVRHAGELNALVGALQASLPPAEFDATRKLVGQVLGERYVAGLYPIFAEYPALKPATFP